MSDASSLLARAGSFGRRNSWRLPTFMPVPPLESTDPEQLHPFVLHPEMLPPVEGGGSLEAMALLKEELMMLSPVDSVFGPFVQDATRKVSALHQAVQSSSLNSGQVPVEYFQRLLEAITVVSRKVDDTRRSLARTKSELVSREKEIQLHSQELDEVYKAKAKAKMEEEEPLPESGLKMGWRGKFWKHRQRDMEASDLQRKAERWGQDEEHDDSADKQLERLSMQFNMAKHVMNLLDQLSDHEELMERMKVSAASVRPEMMACRDKGLQLRKESELDLGSMSRLMTRLQSECDKARCAFRAAITECNEFLPGNELRISEVERLIAESRDDYEAKRVIRDNDTNPHRDRLQRELEELRVQVRAKEQEINESNEEWRRRRQLSVDKGDDLEKFLEADMSRLNARLELLRAERARALECRSQYEVEQASWDRREQQLQYNLQQRRGRLIRASSGAEHLVSYADLVRLLEDEGSHLLVRVVDNLIAEQREQQPGAILEALEAGMMMTTMLCNMQSDKLARIEVITKQIARETTLLEFCIDTHDPNAHKHQEIISHLASVRGELTAEVEAHLASQRMLVSECAVLQQQLTKPTAAQSSTLASLRNRSPSFFQLLSEVAKPPAKPWTGRLASVDGLRTPPPLSGVVRPSTTSFVIEDKPAVEKASPTHPSLSNDLWMFGSLSGSLGSSADSPSFGLSPTRKRERINKAALVRPLTPSKFDPLKFRSA
eukprot:NODE_132_length_2422_cov_83.251580_g115_i0.p1 GENE.NODE_132_length_2422_cov_83.251580_g115_i0~~NODE_132_length_2422_cov_83.251580_g115_i0.p1  ORF type:complete len:721 (+),score=279.22 NODE_132_length_2422_cov_83.251580_g115_i0:109-2271(+)